MSKNGGQVTIAYNGDGTRVAKTVGGVTTKYLVDDLNPSGYSQVMEEVSGGAVQRVYVHGTMLVSQSQLVGGSFVTSYYGYDAQGNVKFLTNATGAVTDTYTYDAFGNLTASTGMTSNAYLYGGQQFDPDLVMYSLRARYYEPGRGRFVTIDPFEGNPRTPSSLHRYFYANGDGANLGDPLGLAPIPAPAASPGGGVAGEYALALSIVGALKTLVVVTVGIDGSETVFKDTAVKAVAHGINCTLIAPLTSLGYKLPLPHPYEHCKPKDDCPEHWALAREMCQGYFEDLTHWNPKVRESARGLMGGYSDIENCAKGHVPERCGGNPIDWGPEGPPAL